MRSPTFLAFAIATAFLAFASTAHAAIAQSFLPPAASSESSSANYTGQTNGTIANGPVVRGKVFDRFIQIWIENTDCECRRSWILDPESPGAIGR